MCYIGEIMAKTLKASSEKHVMRGSDVAVKVVRNAKTGEFVTIKGIGALEGNDFKIKKGVKLRKPIAQRFLPGGQKSARPDRPCRGFFSIHTRSIG